MITIYDAIYAVYPNASVITGDDINSVIVLDKEHQPMTINLSLVTTKLAELQAIENTKQETEITAKASAQAKLSALGLTADEVKAILGTT
jgi:hypothetical protein